MFIRLFFQGLSILVLIFFFLFGFVSFFNHNTECVLVDINGFEYIYSSRYEMEYSLGLDRYRLGLYGLYQDITVESISCKFKLSKFKQQFKHNLVPIDYEINSSLFLSYDADSH